MFKIEKDKEESMKQLYTVRDGSWALIDNGGEKMEHTSGLALKGRQFRLLAMGCDLPAYDKDFRSENIRNDVVLRDVNTNEILFTNKRFIKAQHTFCPTCGQKI